VCTVYSLLSISLFGNERRRGERRGEREVEKSPAKDVMCSSSTILHV
jgi:hypothetical protein